MPKHFESFILMLFCFYLGSSHAQKLDSLLSGGRSAYESGNYEQAARYFHAFEAIRTNYPPVNMYLAAVSSRLGDKDSAIHYLRMTAIINADTSFLSREDFDPIRDSEAFHEMQDLFLRMLEPVHLSEDGFQLDDPQIHPEALAYDAMASRFYIGSIRKRNILAYERGKSYAFKKSGEDGLMAVTGLEVYAEGNLLWSCSAAMSQMEKYEKDSGSVINIYDLSDGRLLQQYIISDPGVLLGDLTVGPDGHAYFTNSLRTEIYRANMDSVWLWKSFPQLRNLQGLSFDDNGRLYISDYINGIYVLDGDSLKRLSAPEDVSVKGIDGLYFRRNNLIGMQNGVFPKRVTQFVLEPTGEKITNAIYLDKNLPQLNEPVQGVWVGDWFYFIANSPWSFYDENNQLDSSAPKPEIWRVNLH